MSQKHTIHSIWPPHRFTVSEAGWLRRRFSFYFFLMIPGRLLIGPQLPSIPAAPRRPGRWEGCQLTAVSPQHVYAQHAGVWAEQEAVQ